MRWAVIAAVLLVTTPAAPAASRAADGARSLVDAERAFARDAAARGMCDAFLAALDDSGVVFRRFAVNGRASWQARPPVPGLLAWEPELAEVSAAGDLGWDTGPWTFRDSTSGPVLATGHYVSLWRRDATGAWRLLCDLGHDHPPVAAPALRLIDPAPRSAARDPARERERLLAGDRSLAARAARAGYSATLAAALATDGRVCRAGAPPALGRAAARAALDSTRTSTCVPQAGEIARSADLGFTRGLALRPAGAGADTASYVRVWRRERDGWKVVLDVETPYPKR